MSERVKSANGGENNPAAKLTLEDVKNIKNMLNNNYTVKQIHSVYSNVSEFSIGSIKYGRTWKNA